MKERGFAVTTMVYASIVLLSVIMFTVLAVVKAEYDNQRTFVEDINKDLTTCIFGGKCLNETNE